MADQATDMRDPMFYRLHAEVDDMFQEYKATLPRYTVDQVSINYHKSSSSTIQHHSQASFILASLFEVTMIVFS